MNFADLKIDALAFANRGAVIDAVIDRLVDFGQKSIEDRLRIPPMEYSPVETAYLVNGARRIAVPSDFLELKYLCFTDQLPTPVNATHTAGAGTLAAGTYYYRVTAVNAEGETLASTETSLVLAAQGGINVNWTKVTDATGYKVYGRTTGSQALIATVGDVATYLDSGAITPSGALPDENTTGTIRYPRVKPYDNHESTGTVKSISTDNAGRPVRVEIVGDYFYFDKYADQHWVYDLRYYRRLASLSDSNQTNWWSDNAEKALLYAVLAEAGDYLEDEPMKKKWETRRDRELKLLKDRYRDALLDAPQTGSINVF